MTMHVNSYIKFNINQLFGWLPCQKGVPTSYDVLFHVYIPDTSLVLKPETRKKTRKTFTSNLKLMSSHHYHTN